MFRDCINFKYVVVKDGYIVEEHNFAYLDQCVHCAQMRIRKILNENHISMKIKKEIYGSYEFKCGCCYYFAPKFYIRVQN